MRKRTVTWHRWRRVACKSGAATVDRPTTALDALNFVDNWNRLFYLFHYKCTTTHDTTATGQIFLPPSIENPSKSLPPTQTAGTGSKSSRLHHWTASFLFIDFLSVFFLLCVGSVSLLLFWPCCCCLSSSIQHLRHAFHTPHATRDQLVNYIFYLMEAHVQRINCLSMLSRILIDRRAALRNIFATTMAIVNNSTEAVMVDEFGSKWSTGGVNKDIDSLWPPCDTCSLR